MTTHPPVRPAGVRLGMPAIKQKIALRGVHAVDQRTSGARHVVDWKHELVDDLGGPEGITAGQRALVEIAVRTTLYLNHIDAHLLERSTILSKKSRRVIPLVLERRLLADSLVKTLTALGLERRARPPKSIAELLSAPPPPQEEDP